ncbi:MAG: FliH/SctL family protein [Desulfobacterales bacterium]
MKTRLPEGAGYAFPEIGETAAAAVGPHRGPAAVRFRRTAPGASVCPGAALEEASRRRTRADLEHEAYCRGFADGEAAGYARGEAAGKEKAAAELDPLLAALRGVLSALEGLRERTLREAEREIVLFALEVARRVVGREVRDGSEVTASIVSGVLRRLEHAERITLRLNPEDLDRLEGSQAALIAQWTAGGRVRLEADPAVSRGGCLADSDGGEIDARLERCFAVVESALLEGSAPERPSRGLNGHGPAG